VLASRPVVVNIALVGAGIAGLAVVIATAAHRAADELITTDRKWPSARMLKLELAIVHL